MSHVSCHQLGIAEVVGYIISLDVKLELGSHLSCAVQLEGCCFLTHLPQCTTNVCQHGNQVNFVLRQGVGKQTNKHTCQGTHEQHPYTQRARQAATQILAEESQAFCLHSDRNTYTPHHNNRYRCALHSMSVLCCVLQTPVCTPEQASCNVRRHRRQKNTTLFSCDRQEGHGGPKLPFGLSQHRRGRGGCGGGGGPGQG